MICPPAQSQQLALDKTWLQLEADWRPASSHSCEPNISLSTQSCCTEPLSSFLLPLLSKTSPVLPALPGCSLLPVRLCPSGGSSGCPWRWAGPNHSRWRDVGLVGWSDEDLLRAQKQDGGFCEKTEGYGTGEVRLVQ